MPISIQEMVLWRSGVHVHHMMDAQRIEKAVSNIIKDLEGDDENSNFSNRKNY
jgi:hypothetical protein